LSFYDQSQIGRLMKEIANLRKADAAEATKEARLLSKINSATSAANKTKSDSMFNSKMKEIERSSKELARIQTKRSGIGNKVADKTKTLQRHNTRQARDDEQTQKKLAAQQTRMIREREDHERRVASNVRTVAETPHVAVPSASGEIYDFFISHASEDKDGFVRELAEALDAKGAQVWYDEFTLKVGDSLRTKIDEGLANSRFGIVVLSEAFFRKEWTNKELNALFAREIQGHTGILPIWHKVSMDEVTHYSPMLADKLALNTANKTVVKIADELFDLLD